MFGRRRSARHEPREGAWTIEVGTQIALGEPAEEPTALLGNVARHLRSVSPFREARRCWAVIGANAPGLVIAVDIGPDTPDGRRAVLSAVSAGVGVSPFTVDTIFVGEGGFIVEWMMANVGPFAVADHA